MAYIDSFIVPVPVANIERYRALAKLCATVWREHGAREFREFVGEDVKAGKLTSFPQSVVLQPDETVMVSWIMFDSRAHRDEVNKKAMQDPRLAPMMDMASMPFDPTRMVYGGFTDLFED